MRAAGLDSLSALHVVRTIKKLSRDICVVCTIHQVRGPPGPWPSDATRPHLGPQPSAELFDMFDWMLLLGKGGFMAYFGKTADMGGYFEANGLGSCPPGVNPAEHALDVTGAGIAAAADGESADAAAERIAQVYLKSSHHEAMSAATVAAESVNASGIVEDGDKLPGPIEQFRVCFWRERNINRRDVGLTRAVLGSTTMISFLASTVYWQVRLRCHFPAPAHSVSRALSAARILARGQRQPFLRHLSRHHVHHVQRCGALPAERDPCSPAVGGEGELADSNALASTPRQPPRSFRSA